MYSLYESKVLMAAKDWGIPPWQVEDGPYRWFERWEREMSMRSVKSEPPPGVDY